MASDTISEYLLTKTVIKQKRKRNNFYGFIKDFKVPMYLEVCVCKSCFKKLHMFQCALNLYRTFQFRLINLPACSWHGRISVAFAVYQCTQTFKWLCDPSAHVAFVAPLSEIWASLRPTELENNKSFAADWSFSIMLIRPHIVCTDKAAEIWSALIVYIFSLSGCVCVVVGGEALSKQ